MSAQIRTNYIQLINGDDSAIRMTAEAGSVIKMGDGSGNAVKLTNLAEPDADNHATTKRYVDSVVQGITWKYPVKVATTAQVDVTTLKAGDVVDGQTLLDGWRILVKDQATKTENGVYVVSATGITRATDMNSSAEEYHAAMWVDLGNENIDQAFVQVMSIEDIDAQLGTQYVKFTGLGQVIAGLGLIKDGNRLDLDVSTNQFEFNPTDESGILKLKVLSADGNDLTLPGTLTVNGPSFLTGGDVRAGVNGEFWIEQSTGNVSTSGTLNTDSNFTVGGNASITGTLGVTGASTLSSTLGVSGAATLSDTLGVTGATTLSSTLAVTGAATLSSTLAVSGLTSMTGFASNGNGSVTGTLQVTGEMTAQAYNMSSDMRLKNTIEDIADREAIVAKMDELRVKSFFWNSDEDKKREYHGFIAQEVQKVFPEAVITDSRGYLAIDYNILMAYVVLKLQDLSAKH